MGLVPEPLLLGEGIMLNRIQGGKYAKQTIQFIHTQYLISKETKNMVLCIIFL